MTTSSNVRHFPRNNAPLDSHQLFANDVFKGQDDVFRHVHPGDRDEVRVQFARMVAEAKSPAGVRVYPLHMTDTFRAARVHGGRSFAAQVKGATGRIYWCGFEEGVSPMKKAA